MEEPQQGNTDESELNERLWAAVAEGNLDDIEAGINEGATISAKDKTGSTAIHQAVRSNNIKIVRFLLEIDRNRSFANDDGPASQPERKLQKPEVNTTNKTGETPLLRAVINNQTDIIKLLLEHGARTGSFDYQGDSELSVAIWNNDSEIASLLIPGIDNLNTRNKDGMTAFLWAATRALHFAASGGHLEFLDFLLNPEALDQSSSVPHTSRMMATTQFPAESRELPKWSAPDLEARQINGFTPLLWAAWNGQRDAIVFLLKYGSKITAVADDGWTALHLAVYGEQIEVVKLLLEIMNGDTIAAGSKDGDTALHVACQGEDESIFEQLLKVMETKCRYAIVHKNRDELTALSVAVEGNVKGFVQLLVNYEADIQYLDMPTEENWPWPAMLDGIDPQQIERTGNILLRLVKTRPGNDSDPGLQKIYTERGQEDVVESLLQKYNEMTPDTLVADEVGPKAIEAAARNGHEEIVSLLIQKLIETDKETFMLKSPGKSTDNWTPLHWAVNYKPEEAVLIVRHMLMNGANPDATLDNVNEPFSAVDLARSLKDYPGFDQDILRLLVTPYRLPKKPIQLEEPVHPESLVADVCENSTPTSSTFILQMDTSTPWRGRAQSRRSYTKKGQMSLWPTPGGHGRLVISWNTASGGFTCQRTTCDLMQRISYESKKSVEDYTRLKNFVEQTRREHPGKIHSRFMYPALNFESKDFHSGEDTNISKLRSENKIDSQEKRKKTTAGMAVSKDLPAGVAAPNMGLEGDAGKEGKRRGLGHKDSHQHTHEETRRKSIAPRTVNETDENFNNSNLGDRQDGTNDVQEPAEMKAKRASKDKFRSPTDALLGSKMGISLPFLTFQSVTNQRKLRQAVRLAEEIQSKQPELPMDDTASLEERVAAENRRLQMARSDAGGSILVKEISAGFEILQSNAKEHERFDDVVSYLDVGNSEGVQQIDISKTIGPLKEYLTTSLGRLRSRNSGIDGMEKSYNSLDMLEWLEKLEDAVAIYEQTQLPPGNDHTSKYEALLEHYLRPEQAKGLHTSRTIDQFYYSSLSDTCRRDMDQVVRRYQARKFGEDRHDNFQMGMVEQLWLWVIDDKTIITCFPKSFGGGIKNGRGRELLEQIRTHIHEDTRPQISSIYHLATIITSHCVRFVEECQARIPGGNESLLQMFSSSVGMAADKEVEYFETFQREIYEARRDKKSKADGDKSKSSIHELDLGKEIKLLEEVKDIRDELNILKSIFEDQSSLLQKLFGLVAGYSPPGGRKGGDQDPIVSFYRQRSDINLRIERVEKMQRDINAIYDSKNANVFEAVQARLGAEETTAQGRTIMVFTIVTIIFLPMSFLTSLYALQVDSFPHDGGDFIYPSKWIWSRIFGTSGAIAIPLCIVAIYINTILDFYEKSVRLRIKKWVGAGVRKTGCGEDDELAFNGRVSEWEGGRRG
ncbi:hypothetical protein IFR05_001741 [Cadophora sp. M221]|nr:hypothetical protein IFR05_001741 [Cadophora sp. M221]